MDLDDDHLSAYAAYESDQLSRLAIVNLNLWDAEDDDDERPTTTFDLGTLDGFESATVELMTAPGGATTNENITIAGMSYDYEQGQGKGVSVGDDIVETIEPGDGESFTVEVGASEAVIVTFHS